VSTPNVNKAPKVDMKNPNTITAFRSSGDRRASNVNTLIAAAIAEESFRGFE
jgi:hypothetical protein